MTDYTIKITGSGTKDEILSSLEDMIREIRTDAYPDGYIMEDGTLYGSMTTQGRWG